MNPRVLALDLATTFFIAFSVALVLVPACRAGAIRFGYTAAPREDRWHRRPTALMGGTAIAITTLGLQAVWEGFRGAPVLFAGVALTFGLGLVDDVVSLKPYVKLVAEIAIASLFVFFGFRLGWVQSLTVDTLLTIVWIVGVTNAFNLLDNMDGLCAGIGLIVGGTLLALAASSGAIGPETTYLALLLGAMAAFLVYNFHPASIFMGDSGSLFIGVSLAVLTIGGPETAYGPSNVLSVIVAPMLILLVPIFDTTLVTVMRVLAGRSAAQGGRDHSSHRLVAIGLSEPKAVMVLWILAGLSGLLALLLQRFETGWPSIGAAVFVLAMMIFAVHLAHVRVYEQTDPSLRQQGGVTPFVVNVLYKRRIAEVGLDVCLVAIAYYSAWRLRFEGADFSFYFPRFLESLPLVVGGQAVVLVMMGAYQGLWRHFSLMDAVTFAKAVGYGTLANVAAIVYLYRFQDYSRGVFIIYGALLVLLLVASRASFRLIGEYANRRRSGGQRLVIYGAGGGASVAIKELLGGHGESYRMIGLIDDNPDMAKTRLLGYPVLGDYHALEVLIANGGVDVVVLSTRLIDVDRLNRLKRLCAEHRVSLARLHFELEHLVAVS